jgi:hypothetical protein
MTLIKQIIVTVVQAIVIVALGLFLAYWFITST